MSLAIVPPIVAPPVAAGDGRRGRAARGGGCITPCGVAGCQSRLDRGTATPARAAPNAYARLNRNVSRQAPTKTPMEMKNTRRHLQPSDVMRAGSFSKIGIVHLPGGRAIHALIRE